MNATDEIEMASLEEEEFPVSLIGIIVGGVVLILAVIITSIILAAMACRIRRAKQAKLHISPPVRPLAVRQNSSNISMQVPEDQALQSLQISLLRSKSTKMSFKARKQSQLTTSVMPATLNTIDEKSAVVTNNNADTNIPQVEIHIDHEPSKPRPINSPSPTHNYQKDSSISISKRPPLPTPSTSRGTASNGTTPPSPTPVAQVRTSQWYDNIRMMFRPLANYRYSGRSIEESSGHYVNEGMGPTAFATFPSISPP